MAFDPEAPLPGPPDPWVPSSMPALRPGPPYAMTEMIAAEPALAERLITRLTVDPAVAALAAEVRRAAGDGRPIVITGCGTSEHAAMAVARLLADALNDTGRVASVQAFELAQDGGRPGVVIGISHEGGTWATNLALQRARAAGARVALVTVGGGSPGAALADLRVLTREQDQSWCHTVGYLSPILAGAVLAAHLREEPVSARDVRDLLATDAAAAEAMAGALAGAERLLVIGSGADHPGARELALKVEEGAHLPATAHHLETLLHGHLAAAGERTGLVLLLAEARSADLVARAHTVLRAARALGMPAAAIASAAHGAAIPDDLTPAGRYLLPDASRVGAPAAGMLASAVALQLLTERLARARGVNPDTLGREDPRQAAAADA